MASIVTTNSKSEKQAVLTVQQAHERLGHINERATKEITKALGWKLPNTAKLNCSSCAAGNTKQKPFKKIKIMDPQEGRVQGLPLFVNHQEK